MEKPSEHTMERPPIVVVMGHVDHGKSKLLDFIRKTNIVEEEAGGITQHVAAYEVTRTRISADEKSSPINADTKAQIPADVRADKRGLNISENQRSHQQESAAKKITFIDTPGHAAFKAIRARGANVADIAILVVAADEGVKEQTLEALASIRDAKIPFIVAINKIDKPNASMERTQASLMENSVYLEKLGGEVPWTAISAKEGTGVDELLELILIVAELEQLKGNPDISAEGYVIEAHRDPKRGIAATLIITNGTLAQGMAVLAGRALSPVRLMENHAGQKIRSATFSSPVSITGFDELPIAGESFKAYRSKRDAEEARSAMKSAVASPRPTAPSAAEGGGKFVMPIVVRADTTGSLEAIAHETARLENENASIDVILSGIGNISENDIKAAAASAVSATVIGFNVEADTLAIERARQHGVRIERFDVIYKLVERLQEMLRESSPKKAVEEIIGKAKILKQFSSRKEMHVVGGSVSEGRLVRGASVRVLRRKAPVGVGKIKNLQSHKQDVERVETGSEFGAQIEAVFEIAQGDSLECFTIVSR